MAKKKKNRGPGTALVFVTIAIAVIGLFVIHGHNQRAKEQDGFVVNPESASQTEPLGSFADFNVTEAPIEYDYSAGDSTADAPALPVPTSAAAAASTTPGASSTAASVTGSTAHNFEEGAAYAYAYAGFTPKQANMNVQWNLLLVNRNYILPQDYVPDLSEAVRGSGVQLDYRAAPHYQDMYDAALKDGITLTPVSGYRAVSRQKNNFENKINYYINQGYDRTEATRLAARIILPPGTSEHNAGLAMDIISLDVDFEESQAFAWLQSHAHEYGFILRYPKDKESITEITYEPWHWRYVGTTVAKSIKNSGKTLEEYLGVK